MPSRMFSTRARRWGVLTAAAALITAVVSGPLASVVTAASPTLTIVSGTPQDVTIGGTYAALVVQATTDGTTPPNPGDSIDFEIVPGGGGAGGTFNGSNIVTTDTTTGNASSPTITANSIAGAFTVTATDTTSAVGPVTFNLTNDPPASVLPTAGTTPQSRTVGLAFPTNLEVQVLDGSSNPVANVTVTFQAPASGASGTFNDSGTRTTTAITNGSGNATAAVFTANGTAGGPYNVTATTGGVTGTFHLTNTAGAAGTVTPTGGTTPQSAVVGNDFGTNLQVQVLDSGSNPVPGVTVTFTAPASGASGTFNDSGTRTTTAITNGSGNATAAVFTANGTAGGPYNVTATTGGVTGTFHLTNTAGAAGTVTPTGGTTPQSAVVGNDFGTNLQVQVLDSGSNPVPGVTVTFTAPASGASGTFNDSGTRTTTAITNGSGNATAAVFTANGTAGGPYNVTATTGGVTGTFHLTNTAGAAGTVTPTGGTTPQSAVVGNDFGTNLQVQVLDSGSNPVPGVTVTFTAPASGASGTFNDSGTRTTTAITNGSGNATAAVFTANGTAGGPYNVTATTGGVTGTFHLTNTAGAAGTVTPTGGTTPQSAVVGNDFGTNLQVQVLDSGSNPVPGVTVTFTAPGSGASGTFANSTRTTTASTNGSGIATASTFTANGAAGGPYTVTAATGGVQGTFSLTNTAGAAGTVTPSGASGTQSATVATAFANNLQVVVRDSGSNPVPNVTVTFTAPAGGASGTFANSSRITTALTDGTGTATASAFTANTTAGGPYTVAASTGGVHGDFSLTNNSGPPATVSVVSGDNQSAPINSTFTPLQVQVTDSFGNAVGAGVTVHWAAAVGGSGATGFFTPPGTSPTDASGNATSTTLTANHIAGGFSATAAVTGATSATFNSLTNVAGSAATVTATVTPSPTTVNTLFGTLTAHVVDAGNNPLSGIVVHFAAPTGPGVPSGTFAGSPNTTATTNGSGDASVVNLKANTNAGAFTVSATVTGVATPATFNLSSTPDVPAAITRTLSSSSPQHVQVGSDFPVALGANVVDQFGNPVSGVVVHYTVTVGGNGATGNYSNSATTNATTDAGGNTSPPPIITAGPKSGTFTAKADAGAGILVIFTLTNDPGGPGTVTLDAGNSQAASVNSGFGSPLTVTVTDSTPAANPVTGANVSYVVTPAADGAAGTFAGGGASTTVTTDGNGVAAVSLTANSIAGSYTVIVRATTSKGTATNEFSVTNAAVPPSQLTSTQVGASSTGNLVTVVWASPDFNGGSPVTSYTVTLLPSGAQITGLQGNSFQFISLTNGASLSIEVSAVNVAGAAPPSPPISVVPIKLGYWMVASDGGIFNFGAAGFYGSTGGGHLNQPIVGMTVSPSGGGYWLVASDGGIFGYGDAQFHGSTGGTHINQPIVAMAATPSGRGYWLVASDGGIFAFGDAQFYGSTGGSHLNQPIVGMAPTASGHGYWLVASDGGIFAFGDAKFRGSTGGMHLNRPIVSMAVSASGNGYWLVASDGGIFTFGDATFHGSTGGMHLNRPILGMALSSTGKGYWLVASDGGIFAFGDAKFYGSMGGAHLNQPIVDIGTQPITHFG